MQTLTITTDSADFIAKAKAVLATLAKLDGVKMSFDEAGEYPIYDDGRSLDEIKASINADIELLKQGKLKTYTLDELRAESARW